MNPNAFAAEFEKLAAVPLDLAACANARAATTAVMLRLLLQQLVENKVIDGAALAERLKSVVAQPHFDASDDTTKTSVSAQQTADKMSAHFLNDLLQPPGQ